LQQKGVFSSFLAFFLGGSLLVGAVISPSSMFLFAGACSARANSAVSKASALEIISSQVEAHSLISAFKNSCCYSGKHALMKADFSSSSGSTPV
jgi:hypothetical protein